MNRIEAIEIVLRLYENDEAYGFGLCSAFSENTSVKRPFDEFPPLRDIALSFGGDPNRPWWWPRTNRYVRIEVLKKLLEHEQDSKC